MPSLCSWRSTCDQGLLLLVAQAGGGFVQQQQRGVGAQGAGNLHQPLRAHGQVAGQLVQVLAHADALQLALRLVHQALFLGAVQAQHGADARRCVRAV